MPEKILNIRLKGSVIEISKKTGETSYDILHVGTLNALCLQRMKELIGGTEIEFVIK